MQAEFWLENFLEKA